jgi:S-adenosylmethionine:tRNA-ribosyltransferase-isomerase (queuine synthetase)
VASNNLLQASRDAFEPLPAAGRDARHRSSNKLLQGRTGLFITPGYEFQRVDSLVTNFHLPRSTLLALVMAFAGVEETRRLYELAIAERYRFYSFGDAMLVR